MPPMYDACEVRDRLAFDVARLAEAAKRLQGVDEALFALKQRLEARASVLAEEAIGSADGAMPQIRHAQAQAIAQLARRAALTEVLRSTTALPLIAAMAVGRWVGALDGLCRAAAGERAVRLHVDAGRVACRILRTLRRSQGLAKGVGRLTSAVVVAEFVHPEDAALVDVEIEHGLYEARFSPSIQGPDAALAAASATLREAAYLLERMASRAEPAVDAILDEADTVEEDVEAELSRSFG